MKTPLRYFAILLFIALGYWDGKTQSYNPKILDV